MTGRTSAELRDLHRLAQLYHLHTSYLDRGAHRQHAGPASLLAGLAGLGAPLQRISEAPDAIRARRRELWQWRLEPVLVAWDGALAAVELRLPKAEAHGAADLHIRLENGEALQWETRLDALVPAGRTGLDGEEFVLLRLPAPETLPLGYHELTLEAGARTLAALVISAPRIAYRPPEGRRWGVFLPLYSLHSSESWGVGDLSNLRRLLDWADEAGAHFVATLPLLASFLDRPFEPSPYLPVSRCFWNDLYMDVRSDVTSGKGPVNDHGAVLAAAAAEARRLNARESVPYQEAMALKRRVLREHTRRYLLQDPANPAVRSFMVARPAAKAYSAFRAAVESLGPSWRAWPERQRTGTLTEGDYDKSAFDYHVTAQAICHEQMLSLSRHADEAGVRLFLDLPVGVHPDGFDAWRYKQLFVEEVNLGAPPDMLATEGQNWGFRPINPEAARRSGYEYAREYLQHHMQAAGILRVDHAIGIHRQFWIPSGFSSREGVFVQQPAEETYALLSLESHRNRCIVIGENLGLVPPEVNRGLGAHGIDGMYVQIFQMTGDSSAPLRPVPERCMASFGTHDLAPFAAFWSGEDLRERQRIGLLDDSGVRRLWEQRQPLKSALSANLRSRGITGDDPSTSDVYHGSTQLLAECRADWVLVNLEDTWQETRYQNIPGTAPDQYPNWRRRARHSLEQFGRLPELRRLTGLLGRYRPKEEAVEPPATGQ